MNLEGNAVNLAKNLTFAIKAKYINNLFLATVLKRSRYETYNKNLSVNIIEAGWGIIEMLQPCNLGSLIKGIINVPK